MLCQRLRGGRRADGGAQGGDGVDQSLRVLAGDHRPHNDLVVIYRRVDHAALIQRLQLIIQSALLHAVHIVLTLVDGQNLTNAGTAVNQKFSGLEHFLGPPFPNTIIFSFSEIRK